LTRTDLFAGVSAQTPNFRGEHFNHSPGGIVSRSLNKVTLIGNLGADPEVRSTTGGNRVATFSLATSRSWNNQSGDKQEKTEWHRCVVWNTKGSQLADIVEKYVKKGDKIYVEGRIEYRQWTDKEGQTRYSTEINVRELIHAGRRPRRRRLRGQSRNESQPRT
jgi:single-strand DNA-binding protein